MNGKGPEDARAPAVPPPLEWKFSQVFGERAAGEEVQEVDIISAIEFDKSGDHLATGDRGGRVVLFERTDVRDHGCRRDLESLDYPISRHPEFRYKTEFQSHEPEFDYLKSLEIEEKINKIRWCQMANGALFLLSTNDKTIKFWKVQEKKVKRISKMNLDPSQAAANGSIASSSTASPRVCLPNGGCSYNYMSNDFSFPPGGFPSLRLPAVASQETSLVARCRRIYAHAHDYHINSISNNSDGETFISADDLRINLWNLEISNQSFNIVDVKPANMEDLTEVITSAEFHPNHCNTLAYSSSKGSIRLIDLRQSALCDNHSQLFEEAPGSRSFFTEIIASISDIKFGQDGRHILSRDYMTLKLWDINMDSGPVATFQVHEYLRPQKLKLGREPTIVESFNRTHKTKQGMGGYVDKRSEAVMAKYSAEYSKKYGDASTSDAPPRDYDLWFEATGVPTHGHVYGFSPLEDLTGIIGQSSSSSTSTSQAPELYTHEDLLHILEQEKKKWQEEVLQKMREEIGFGPRHADRGSNGDSGSADHASL